MKNKTLMTLIILLMLFVIPSDMALAATKISTPAAPKAAAAGYNQIKVSWKPVKGATGYQLRRSVKKTGNYSTIKSTTATSYINTNLVTGRTYYYKVRAYKTIGSIKYYSKYSAIVTAKPIPSVPADLNGKQVNSTSNQVSWSKVNGASGYQVYRTASSAGTYSLIQTTSDISYTDNGLTSGKTYYYKVRAYKTEGTAKVYGKLTNPVKLVTLTEEYDSVNASKNISSEFKEMNDGVIAILSNNNSYPIDLSATMVFYDETGAMLNKSTENNYYFEAGKRCALYFTGPYDKDYEHSPYSSYKIIYSIDDINYKTSNLSDIITKSNFGIDNVMVEVTNSGSEACDSTLIAVVFYKDGKTIGYNFQYADCSTPGSTDYLEFSFPYDSNYDKIQPDDYEIYVNASYQWSW